MALGGRRACTGRVRTRDAQASPPDGPQGPPQGLSSSETRKDGLRWRRPGEGPSVEEGPPHGRHEGTAGPPSCRARFVGAGVGDEVR